MRSLGHTSLHVAAGLVREGAHQGPIRLNMVAMAAELELDRGQLYHCIEALARRGIVSYEPGYLRDGIEITSVGMEILEYYVRALDPLIQAIDQKRRTEAESEPAA